MKPLCQALFWMWACFAAQAHAETYIFQVRGVVPETPVKTATCNEENDPCFLTLPVGEQGRSIDIAANFYEGMAQVLFMMDREYLAVTPKGETLFKAPIQKTRPVLLYTGPKVIEKGNMARPPTMRPVRKIAALEISVAKAPESAP